MSEKRRLIPINLKEVEKTILSNKRYDYIERVYIEDGELIFVVVPHMRAPKDGTLQSEEDIQRATIKINELVREVHSKL
ncbi:hypothetical protein [Paenibacillus massiliensis]|uniref:hypothetical protein n=1 Tax=Paenibacillus massiliensis TaxID=225917 RepID=UPI000472B8EC|nr:hypothetical protein [Paenibacillus massiliensis]